MQEKDVIERKYDTFRTGVYWIVGSILVLWLASFNPALALIVAVGLLCLLDARNRSQMP